MAKYKEIWESFDDPTVIGYHDTEEGGSIPLAPGNRHYRMVQEWLAEGNTPDPMYTQAEIDTLAADQAARELKRTEAEDEIKLGVLANKTYAQVENYVQNNVTNLADAKDFLKLHARITLAIIKRLDLDI